MKKSSCIFVIIFLVVSALPITANTSANLSLTGFIGELPGELSLILTRTPEQEEPIDLSEGVDEKSVGTLEAYTNDPPYKISITSSNGYDLVHADETAIPYTLLITGGEQVEEGGWSNNPDWPNPDQEVDFEHWGTVDNTYDLAVSITGVDPGSYPQGEYTDTLTFNIRAAE